MSKQKKSTKRAVWLDKVFFDVSNQAHETKCAIEAMCIESQTAPEDLPEALIPTHVLYELVAAYSLAYDMLVEYQLINAGHHKQSNTIH